MHTHTYTNEYIRPSRLVREGLIVLDLPVLFGKSCMRRYTHSNTYTMNALGLPVLFGPTPSSAWWPPASVQHYDERVHIFSVFFFV